MLQLREVRNISVTFLVVFLVEGHKLCVCYDVLFTDETLLTNFLKLLKAVSDYDGIT